MMIDEKTVLVDLDAALYLAALRITDDEITVENSFEMIDDYVKHKTMGYVVKSITYVFTHPDSPKGGRYEVYPEYQEGRDTGSQKTPIHLAMIQELCNGKRTDIEGHQVIIERELEADDVLVRMAHESPTDCVVLSSDKDISQVKGIHISLHADKKVETDDVGFIEKKGNGYIFTGITGFLYQTIVGDKADSVPGLSFLPEHAALFMPTKAQAKQLEEGKTITGKEKQGPSVGFKLMEHYASQGKSIRDIFKIVLEMQSVKDVQRNAQLVYMQRGISISQYVSMFGDAVPTVKGGSL